MLKNRDFTSNSNDWLIEQAMDFMLFVTTEDAKRVIADMTEKVYALAYRLSVLNNEFECAFYKSIDNIKTYFVEPAIKNMTEDTLALSSKILEDKALSVTQKILNIDDKGATMDGLMDFVKSNYSSLPNAKRAYNMITIAKKLRDIDSIDSKFVTKSDIISGYDTYCINFFNILFEKYQEMLSVYETISNLIGICDALKIAEIMLSKENLITYERVSDFLKDEDAAKQTIKSSMQEYMKGREDI